MRLTLLHQNAKKEFAFQAYWPDEDSGPELETPGEDAWSDVVPVPTLDYENLGSKYVSRPNFCHYVQW